MSEPIYQGNEMMPYIKYIPNRNLHEAATALCNRSAGALFCGCHSEREWPVASNMETGHLYGEAIYTENKINQSLCSRPP